MSMNASVVRGHHFLQDWRLTLQVKDPDVASFPLCVSQDVDRQHRCQGDLGLPGKPHGGSGPSHRERCPLSSLSAIIRVEKTS